MAVGLAAGALATYPVMTAISHSTSRLEAFGLVMILVLCHAGYSAVNAAVKRPDIVKLWTQQGAVPMSMTPEEFDKFLRGDIVKWAEVVKKFDKPK